MARTGKIARLPHPLRNELNRRLMNGQPGPYLLDWINAEPDAKSMLAAHFSGHPITLQNLSEWRQGGFEDWFMWEDTVLRAGRVGEAAQELEATGPLAERLATLLCTRYVELFYDWDKITDDEKDRKLRQLGSFTRNVMKFRDLELEKGWKEIKELKAKAAAERAARLAALEAEAEWDETPEEAVPKPQASAPAAPSPQPVTQPVDRNKSDQIKPPALPAIQSDRRSFQPAGVRLNGKAPVKLPETRIPGLLEALRTSQEVDRAKSDQIRPLFDSPILDLAHFSGPRVDHLKSHRNGKETEIEKLVDKICADGRARNPIR